MSEHAWVLENVAGLAYKVHGEALRLLEDTATELGYTTSWRGAVVRSRAPVSVMTSMSSRRTPPIDGS